MADSKPSAEEKKLKDKLKNLLKKGDQLKKRTAISIKEAKSITKIEDA